MYIYIYKVFKVIPYLKCFGRCLLQFLQCHNVTNVTIYISNWIIEYIHIYSYTVIYSCTVNENLMLICIELSELIIYCKYA